MLRCEEYGKIWDLVPDKGQLGLLRENHYRLLFSPVNRDDSFRPNDVWLDIGANIGAFAIRAAEYVKEVIAVEPDELNLECLDRNIKLNQVNNVIQIRAAVIGGNDQVVDLAISNTFSSTHRLGKIRGRKNVEVEGININSIVEKYGVNKIKIDCEGTEAEILENMDFDPIQELVFEYHFSFLKDTNWTRFYMILALLQNSGFLILKKPVAKSKTWHTIVWARKL